MTRLTHDLLISVGYKLIEDAWQNHGRKTYIHDDDADLFHIRKIGAVLRPYGWVIFSSLRSLKHPNGEIIEVEPGGSDTNGHFLHHMKDQ